MPAHKGIGPRPDSRGLAGNGRAGEIIMAIRSIVNTIEKFGHFRSQGSNGSRQTRSIIALDEALKLNRAPFRTPVLPCPVAIYLPMEMTLPIFLCGLIAWLVERRLGVNTDAEREHAHQPGVLFAAGLITGEALMGIVIAIPIVVSGRGDVLALPEQWQFGQWLGLGLVAAVAWFLFRASTRPRLA